VLRGAILDRYLAHGGAPVLGFPTTDDVAAADGGAKADLQGGAVYWSSATGRHVVRGQHPGQVAEWGAESGALGYPTGDDAAAPNGGYLTTFRGGTVWWSPSDRREGAARRDPRALRRARAGPGPRLPDDGRRPGGRRRCQGRPAGRGGLLVLGDRAHVVRGHILARWREWGAESGALGYPTGDDGPRPSGGYLTTFRGGTGLGVAATGGEGVRGAILQR
jgi:uncharacterized protein with LGFP repeats